MQLKSSLISFNHHFDSPVIPTERKGLSSNYRSDFFLFPYFYSAPTSIAPLSLIDAPSSNTMFSRGEYYVFAVSKLCFRMVNT